MKLAAGLPMVLFLFGCTDFDEPARVDPAPVAGCYVAPEAPSLSVQETGVRIGQRPEMLPFRYQQEKVGMVLAIPMVALIGENGFELRPGDEHFYRVLRTNEGPVIKVAFGPDGTLRHYKRRSENQC